MRSKTCKASAQAFYKSQKVVHFDLVTPQATDEDSDAAQALLFGSVRPKARPASALEDQLAQMMAGLSEKERALAISDLNQSILRYEENSMDQGGDDEEDAAPARAPKAKATKKKRSNQ